MYTSVIGIKRMVGGGDQSDRLEPGDGDGDARDAAAPRWWVILMQKVVRQGPVDTEK
jgi:hypothetical protein